MKQGEAINTFKMPVSCESQISLLIPLEWYPEVFSFQRGFVKQNVALQPFLSFCLLSQYRAMGYLNGCHITSHVRRSWIIQSILIEFKKCPVGLYWVPFRNIFRVLISLAPSPLRRKRRSFQFQKQLNIEIFFFTLKFQCKEIWTFWRLEETLMRGFWSKNVKNSSYIQWNQCGRI